MSKLEMVRGLYEYNEWADRHVLEAAGRLTEDEFSRKQGASFESVEGNLAHIVAGQVVWLQRWTSGSNPKSLMELQSIHGLPAIREAFARSHEGLRAFIGSLTDQRLSEVLAYTDSRGNANEHVMWQLMAHVANHGTHHRAETAMAMAAMGKPMRELDYVFFETEKDGEVGSKSRAASCTGVTLIIERTFEHDAIMFDAQGHRAVAAWQQRRRTMVTQTPIVNLDGSQISDAGKVLGRAFWDDPAAIYVMPDDARRSEQLTWFMTNAARYGDLFGSVHTTSEKVEGAAIWLPPEETHVSDEKMSQAGFDELPDRLGEEGYERFGNMFGRMDELHDRDVPEPHWYLFILGVDPPRQGQGVGSAIIRQGLDRADAAHLPCYLETDESQKRAVLSEAWVRSRR